MPEKPTWMNRLALTAAGLGVVLVAGGTAGWVAAIGYVAPQITRLEELLQRGSSNQTQTTSTVQIIPVEPSLEPEQNRLPSVFRASRLSPMLQVVHHVSGEGFVTKEQRLGFAVALTSDGWLVAPASALNNLRLTEVNVVWSGHTVPIVKGIKDTVTNLVYLKIQATDLPVATLLRTDEVAAGQAVWVEENKDRYVPQTITALRAEPMNEPTSSEELVRRYALSEPMANTAAVWDRQGRLVGLLDGVAAQSLAQRVLPAAMVDAGLRSILSVGEIRHASLGVTFLDLADVTEQTSVRKNPLHGALLAANRTQKRAAVLTTGPANKFLKEGDVIERIERDVLDGTLTLSERILEYRPGAIVTIAGQRQGQSFEVKIPLASIVTSEVLK